MPTRALFLEADARFEWDTVIRMRSFAFNLLPSQVRHRILWYSRHRYT